MNAPTGRGRGSREEYWFRINRVMDYVERNLGESLTLEILANVACLSPFHFHKVFSAMMGETLGDFVQRVRIEKAATLLLSDPQKPITEVALDCGYASSAAFARAFKKAYGTSASQWRERACSRPSLPADGVHPLLPAAGAVEVGILSHWLDPSTRAPQWTIRCRGKAPVRVEIQRFTETHVAYVRYIGRFQGQLDLFMELFSRLARWAEPRGLLRDPAVKWLTICHDNPALTDDHRLRISCCLTVPPQTSGGGEIGTMTVPGGDYVVGHFGLAAHEYGLAWHALMAGWLPESGYQPDDRPCFELYSGSEQLDCGELCEVDLCVPVRPL